MRKLLRNPIVGAVIAKVANEARKPENQKKIKDAASKAYDQYKKRRRTR
ncbi:hypothetical protein J2S40_001514 [Nocardioides luteus]|uniref:Uncharacterized protein n=1 Tax=Nocardioides luteus TaxID=1844 RepID=A0ABQ5T2R1_9ACTN|nr:hypothetical protein [Nocardioides luteus]MDR7310456.1 hypothetical protein [Nocardioides luteus]GGR52594.1 hypothetical protein GCM10010197_18480 [Nocardioides luteus]GLJ69764.1 hypothetical protein GCM10017579_38000 [Nocardioides luteus]